MKRQANVNYIRGRMRANYKYLTRNTAEHSIPRAIDAMLETVAVELETRESKKLDESRDNKEYTDMAECNMPTIAEEPPNTLAIYHAGLRYKIQLTQLIRHVEQASIKKGEKENTENLLTKTNKTIQAIQELHGVIMEISQE